MDEMRAGSESGESWSSSKETTFGIQDVKNGIISGRKMKVIFVKSWWLAKVTFTLTKLFETYIFFPKVYKLHVSN